jgi:TolB-like protein/DNA-binding winged helix-turn-helix (wHTH) protein/Tfp pilus assembly protein PilF
LARGFKIAGCVVQPHLNSLERDGHTLRLEPKVMQVLARLADQQGDLVTKDQLMHSVWRDTFVNEEALTRCISELRKALNDDPKQPRFIETIPKSGYRLLTPVQPLSGAASTKLASQWWKPILLALGSAIMVVFFVIFAVPAQRSRLLEWLGRARAERSLHPQKSIAVLPLENLSADPSQEYFADGMTDGLITDLAKIGSLRVISRTSVMQYKHAHEPLPGIARALHVDLIVTGTVRRLGDRVRITAQLVDGNSDSNLWAQEFERDVQNVLRLESDLAYDIAREIRAEVTKADGARLQETYTVNSRAHDVYLRGRFEWNQKTVASLEQSIELYKQAIDLDPQFALAYAGLADSYIVLGEEGRMSPIKANPLISAAATKAVELGADLAEAHMVLAASKELDWDWTGAEREYRRAIDLNPGLSRAHHWYAFLLVVLGRSAEGVTEIRRAVDLDPLGNRIHRVEAIIYYYARQYELAEQTIDAFAGADKNSFFAHCLLGRIRLARKDYASALSELSIASRAEIKDPAGLALLMYAYSRQGNKGESLKWAAKLKQMSEHQYVSPYWMAVISLGFDDHNKAISLLNDACQTKSAGLMALKVDPLFDPLRSDPRFQDLLRKIGLSAENNRVM